MHRRQSLRPRQLDVHSKIRLVRSEADIDIDVAQDGSNLAQNVTTFQELAEMVDDQPVKPKRKKNIPIPVNKIVETYEKEILPTYQVPTSYIKMSLNYQNAATSSAPANSTQPSSEKVEFDLEVEDIEWLRSHPRYGELADPRYQIPLETFAKMLDLLEKASALINPGVITLAEADEIFSKQLQLVRSPCHKASTDVYNYWVAKRQALKRPLLRKYWPQTPLNDTNPHLVFRPREKERYKLRKHRKNDMEGLRKLQQLRNDFDRVRTLLDMVRRREKLKRLLVDFMDETRAQAVHEMLAEHLPQLPPRQPKIPNEDDLKPKKKKKKKHQQLDGSQDSASGSTSMPSSLPPLAFADTQKLKIPSFLEKSPREVESGEAFSCYPPTSSELYASILNEQPTFKCRWRKGRGGRIIMDRLPQYQAIREIQAPPPLSAANTNNESDANRKSFNRQTLESICNMSDSEDELVDWISEEDKVRPTKFMFPV